MPGQNRTYFSNLDASRFLAFFSVFLAHCFVSSGTLAQNPVWVSLTEYLNQIGILGLDYFFVLSSFLITWIILEEKQNSGEFRWRNFMVRRSLRIWPLYFLIVLLGYSAFGLAQLRGMQLSELPNIVFFLTFTSNFYIVENGVGFLFFLVFLWSISVEEQFYVFWSAVLKSSLGRIEFWSIVLILVSVIYRFYTQDTRGFTVHTFSVLGNFGMGSLAASLAFERSGLFIKLKKAGKTLSWVILFSLLGLWLAYPFWTKIILLDIFSRVILSLFMALFILDQTQREHSPVQLGKFKWLDRGGKISYGLYCYHGVVITALIWLLQASMLPENFWLNAVVYPAVILSITVLLSKLSYTYFESYFLQLKKRFYNSPKGI